MLRHSGRSLGADRPRHELANDPLVFINDLPETTLSGLDQDELLALAKIQLRDNQQNRSLHHFDLHQLSYLVRVWHPKNTQTTLSGLDQDELLALAKTNSEAIHVDFKTVPVAKLSETLVNFGAIFGTLSILPSG